MKKVHLICNAHIDPVWQWDWSEGASATLSTFYTAVRLAKQFDYIFCHNEVAVYKYIEEYAPELFSEIVELVKLGKWHIMGGWYLQPDCNMPQGESIVRHIREGQRYFREKFNASPTTAINFDPFGHSVGLVQIIKKCGQDSYMFNCPNMFEMPLPCERFIWRGLDGSEIKVLRTGTYSSPLGRSAEKISGTAAGQTDEVGTVLWGVGNHGGGPSFKDLKDIEEKILPSKEIQYLHSTPEALFAEISPTEVIDYSINPTRPGCYTSMRKIKKLHAALENELYLAEKMATAAYARKLLPEYPEKELRTATIDLLNAEFHDILPGTAVKCGEIGGIRWLDHGLLEAEQVKIKAFFALTKMQNPAKEGEFPIIIFNPHPYKIDDYVECEFMLADQNWSGEIYSHITLLDEEGREVACQKVKEDSNLNLDWRKRIVFKASIEPLSVARYSVFVVFRPVEKKSDATAYDEAANSAIIFDNGRKFVQIDKNTGLLKSYRVDGIEYVTDGFELVSFDDNADSWALGASNLERVGRNERSFSLSEAPNGLFKGMKSVQITEDGDMYISVEAFFEQDNSRARVLYKIYKDNDDVDIDVDLFFGDIDRIIKLKVPFETKGELIGQTVFGTHPLFTNAKENVAHRFIAIDKGDGKNCPVLMNTDVYGSHYENGALYMSLVRGITYCAHPIGNRDIIPKNKFTPKVDQGENNYSFRLTVVDRAQLERRTLSFTQKPYALNMFPIPTKEDAYKDFEVSVSGECVVCAAMKKADGREAVIFRLVNNSNSDTAATLTVNDVKLGLSFGKYEVKTVLWEDGCLSESYEMLI